MSAPEPILIGYLAIVRGLAVGLALVLTGCLVVHMPETTLVS